MTATLSAVSAPAPEILWHKHFGSKLAGALTTVLGAIGVWIGLVGLFGAKRSVEIGWLLPLSGVQLELDPLGGFFLAITGAVAIPVGICAIGYAQHVSGVTMAVLPLFVAAMLVVPAAGSVTTFVFAWELMAIASLVLVLSDHGRPEVRSAGLLYAVMTQLGLAAILVGLMVLSAAGGGNRFADLTRVPDSVRTAVFLLTMVGFGSKAGLLPLHAWLPRAHPEAPSPVSALMSAAMVNLGIYGIIRFDLQLLGPGPRWWGLVLLAVVCPRPAACGPSPPTWPRSPRSPSPTPSSTTGSPAPRSSHPITPAPSAALDTWPAPAACSDARVEHPTTALTVTEARATAGDVLARYSVRCDEFAASADLAAYLVESHTGPTEYVAAMPSMHALSSGVGITKDGAAPSCTASKPTVRRSPAPRIVDPSWFNWPALPVAMADTIVPDFPLANKSFNLSYAGNDL